MRKLLSTSAPVLATLGSVALVLLVALPAQGQDVPTEGPAFGTDLRQDALEAALVENDFVRSAERLVRTVDARGINDIEACRTLELAGRLYHHAGRLGDTHEIMERAATMAYHEGEGALSARLFLDAAEAAVEDGKPRAAWLAGQRAGYVLRISDVTPEQRTAILARVAYADNPTHRSATRSLARVDPEN